MAAALALPEVAPLLDTGLASAAARAPKAAGPARGEQVGPTGSVIGEAPLKLDDRAWEGGAAHTATVDQASDGPNRIVM